MSKYKYLGKTRTAAGGKLIFPDCEHDLDPKDPHVKSLVAQKLLVPVTSEIQKTIKENTQNQN